MLTTSDIEQIDEIFVRRLAPIEKDISGMKKDISGLKEDVSILKKDVSYLKKKANKTEKDIDVIVRLFDNDIMDSKKRIERLEIHTRIPITP